MKLHVLITACFVVMIIFMKLSRVDCDHRPNHSFLYTSGVYQVNLVEALFQRCCPAKIPMLRVSNRDTPSKHTKKVRLDIIYSQILPSDQLSLPYQVSD